MESQRNQLLSSVLGVAGGAGAVVGEGLTGMREGGGLGGGLRRAIEHGGEAYERGSAAGHGWGDSVAAWWDGLSPAAAHCGFCGRPSAMS
ncbi:MAG: hypothetical protein H6708_16760 [Kofleriaceae bacterium]|nr:hypothetical protein [Myxococcales bacterium]MCB9562056.1 hypothetical protein [Kofleriaceae bacterium]